MLRALKIGFFLWLFTSILSVTLAGAPLKAGVAKVEITPPAGLTMWGYFDRATPSTSTLDPLYARVLVLEAGESRLAVVALDLGRTFGPDSLQRLREAVRKSSGIANLLVTASHTHAGPVILDEYPSGQVPAWETAAIEKIVQAVAEAHDHMVEARLGAGYGVTYIGHNRRRVNPDGSVTMFWRNQTKVPTAPLDPTVAVMRVDTAAGKPLAILVNYACHPVVFAEDNLQYSADFPGVMTTTVERAFGGELLCLFLQGAPGDINPYTGPMPLAEGPVKVRDRLGEQLGQEAVRVAKDIRTDAVAAPTLDFAEDLLTFRLRWDPGKFRQALLTSYGSKIFGIFAPPIRQEIQMPVTTALINKRIALMAVPGEPFVDFQMNWRDRCPVPYAFFLGYTNGYFGYFPTIRAATEGGYGASGATTWVEVGAGERMVNHALVKIYEMLGRLSDIPEDLTKP